MSFSPRDRLSAYEVDNHRRSSSVLVRRGSPHSGASCCLIQSTRNVLRFDSTKTWLLAKDRTRLQRADGFHITSHVPRNEVPNAIDKIHVREAESAESTAVCNCFAVAKLEADDRDRRHRMQAVAA